MVLSTHLGCLVSAFERCSRPPTPVFVAGPRMEFENMPGPPLITPPEQLEYGGAPVWARLGAANCSRCGRTSVNFERRRNGRKQVRSGVRLHKNMRIFEYTTEYTRNYNYDTMSSYAKLLDIHLSSIRISYDCNTI